MHFCRGAQIKRVPDPNVIFYCIQCLDQCSCTIVPQDDTTSQPLVSIKRDAINKFFFLFPLG